MEHNENQHLTGEPEGTPADLPLLREYAARAAEDTAPAASASASNARLRLAAQAVIRHAEEFPIAEETGDGDGGDGGEEVSSTAYVASLITDLLHLAEHVQPGGARAAAETARDYLADSGTPLRGATL